MSDTTQKVETVTPSEPKTGGVQDDIKQKVQLMKQEFNEAILKAKPHIAKTAQTADNPGELLYEKLGVLESHLFNKVNPLDNWREDDLKRLRKALTEGKQEIISVLDSEFKRSAESTLAFEIDPIVDEIDNALANYKYWIRERIDAPLTYQSTEGYLYYEPYGVALVIGDWQNPLNSILRPTVSALAAGNHVILYPDPKLKKVSDVLKSALSKFIDEKRVQVITNEVALEKLIDLPINFVYATGDQERLQQISKLAANKNLPTALFRTGLNIGVVHESADLNLASERLVLARFVNSGQWNTSPDHIYVHSSVFTDFFVKCKIHIFCNYKSPDKNRDYSRILDVDYTKKLLDILATKHEGKLETKVNYNVEQKLIEPVIITDPSDDSIVLRDPVRGPILVIKKYQFFDDLASTLAAKNNVNNVYFFNKSLQAKLELTTKIRNAHIFINEAGIQNLNTLLPVGSVGGIFNAKIGNAHGFKTFSSSRVVYETKGLRGYKNLIPPFTADKYKKFHSLDVLKKYTVRQGRLVGLGAGVLLAYHFLGGK